MWYIVILLQNTLVNRKIKNDAAHEYNNDQGIILSISSN
jgi:hypothetical protein